MFNPSPEAWLGAGFNSDSTAHSVSFQTYSAPLDKLLNEVDDAEIDKTTGDVRKLFISLVEAMYQAQESQAKEDRPTQMRIMRRTIGGTGNTIRRQYSFSFTMDLDGDLVVSDE